MSNGLRTVKRGPLTYEMDVWQNLTYGQHPEQSIDAWELNDLAPRAGWPAILFFHDGPLEGVKREAFRVQAPLLARKGIIVACASIRRGAKNDSSVSLEDAIAAIDRLLGLQINPKRIGLWGIGKGADLALAAAEQLEEDHIRAVVAIGANTSHSLDKLSDRALLLSRKAGLREQKKAQKWMLSALADHQRGSKWKIRLKS
jgi:acetyl esterase/lipase